MNDQNCLVTNLALLKSKDSQLCEAIIQAKELPFCRSNSGHLNVILDGITLHSIDDPISEAKHWVAQQNLDSVGVLFVYGIGLGYYYEELKHWLDEDGGRYVVFIEDDIRVIRAFAKTSVMRDFLADPQASIRFWDKTKDNYFEQLALEFSMVGEGYSSLISYSKIKSDVTGFLRDSISGAFIRITHRFMEQLNEKSHYNNLFNNLLHLSHDSKGEELFGCFENEPFIICGAGPSLSSSFAWLKKVYDKALFAASFSAFNSLEGEGIIPHFVAGVDPACGQYERVVRSGCFEVPMFYKGRFNNAALNIFQGKTIFLTGFSGYSIGKWFEEQLGINCDIGVFEGVSISCLLIDLAVKLGCSPIILVGMDLAFTDGSYFSSGIYSSEMEQKAMQRRKGMQCLCKDVYGKDVLSSSNWIMERDWIDQYVMTCPNQSFINATGGGIGFKNIPNLSLEEVSRQYLTRSYDVTNVLYTAIQKIPFVLENDSQVIHCMSILEESLVNVLKLCEEIFLEISIITNKDGTLGERLSQLEQSLYQEVAYEQVIKDGMIAYDYYVQRKQGEIVRNAKLSQKQKILRIVELYNEKFEYVKRIADNVLEALEETLCISKKI